MTKSVSTFLLLVLLFSCTKEVKIDIPGYKAELVVDGRIETNGFPIVLLSRSANIYSETDLANDMEYVLKKLGIAEREFKIIMSNKPIPHLAYPNNNTLFNFFKQFS